MAATILQYKDNAINIVVYTCVYINKWSYVNADYSMATVSPLDGVYIHVVKCGYTDLLKQRHITVQCHKILRKKVRFSSCLLVHVMRI